MLKPYFSTAARVDKFRNILFSWVGTSFRHGMALKNRGADCSLFIGACCLEAGLIREISHKYYPRDWHIHGETEVFLSYLEENQRNLTSGLQLQEISKDSEKKFGDWLVFTMSQKRLSNHSAVFLTGNKMIHSAEKVGVCEAQVDGYEKHLSKVYRLMEEFIG